MREDHLYEQLAQYLNLKHPQVIYHFDLSGVNNKSKYSRSLYSRLNGRSWPDLFIANSAYAYTVNERGQRTYTLGSTIYHGLFLELKRAGSSPYRKDGTLKADEHVERQAAMLESLRACGYAADFAVGFDDAVAKIEAYLGTAS